MGTLTERPPPRVEPPKPPRERRRRTDRRRTERRLLALGLLASVVIHVLIVGVASRLLPVPPQAAPPSATAPAPAPGDDVMRAFDITEIAAAEEPTPTEPEERQPPRPDQAEPVQPEADVGETETAAPQPRSAVERLRPQVGDRRLWVPPSELAPPARPAPMDEARDRIAGRIDVLNDSMVAAMERERRSREWVVEGEDGEKWGVSPGKLHLGDITLPLPIQFPMSAETRQRMGEWNAIRSQAARQATRDYLEERAKAIRERLEKERAEKDGGDEDPPPEDPPPEDPPPEDPPPPG